VVSVVSVVPFDPGAPGLRAVPRQARDRKKYTFARAKVRAAAEIGQKNKIFFVVGKA